MGDNDQGYKLLFSDPAMVRDLLVGFVREDWIERIDFASLERVSGSYVSDDLRERHDDVVWRVRLASDWLYAYVLLEFQSSVDRYMALRVMTYVALLYQDLVRTGRTARGGRLPPVLPIVLYNGEDPWNAATDVARLVEEVPGQLGRYRPRLEYLLVDEGADSAVDLAPEHNLVAALFRLEKSRSPDVMTDVLVRLFEWLREPQAASLRRSFAVFLNRVYFGKREGMAAAFAAATSPEELRTMLAKNLERWERAAEDRGRDEERRALARKLIARGVDLKLIAEATERSEETIASLCGRE